MSDFDKLTKTQLVRACELAQAKIAELNELLDSVAAYRKTLAGGRRIFVRERNSLARRKIRGSAAMVQRLGGCIEVTDAVSHDLRILLKKR